MRTKKLLSMGLSLVLAVSMLAGCAVNKDTPASVSMSVSEEKQETPSSVTAPATSVDKGEDTVPVVTEPVEEEPKYEETPGLDEASDTVEFPEGTKMITFSGKRDKAYLSKDYGAYEGEKYILLVDKNVELPGNYADILNDIVDTIEQVSGLSFNTERTNFTQNMVKTYEKETPWEGLKPAGKVIIQLNNSDRDPYTFPAADIYMGYVTLYDRGLYTSPNEPVWESDYTRIITILINELFTKNYPNLAASDNADEVVEYYVIEALEEKYPDFKRMVNEINYEAFRRDVTEDDAENVWVIKHRNWPSWDERTTFEELFIHFMLDKYGNEFFGSIVSDNYADRNLSRRKMADRIIKIYGEDVFAEYIRWVQTKLPDSPQVLDLSSITENVFYTEANYYLEGERCFFYIEKGIYVPRNYFETAEEIVTALEKKMWNQNKPINYAASLASQSGTFYGISNNNKLPIVLACDEENMGYISVCYDPDVQIYDYGMRDGKLENIEYDTLAHECSHSVMGAVVDFHKLGKIMTEGSANYYAEYVIDELGMKDNFYSDNTFRYHTKLTADTAEALFKGDFDDVTHADRGAEYAYGYHLTKYLIATYGDEYLTTIKDTLKTSKIKDSGGYGDDADREERLRVFKEAFGDDLFTEFGKWYVNNK